MAVLYISQQGASVRLVEGRIVVRLEKTILQEMPAFKLEQIVSFGNVHLTPAVISFCLERGVDVAFLSTHGKYRGRLQSPMARNAALRLRQYERATDSEFCLTTSAAIVAGKVKSMMAMIRRQRRLREEGRSRIAQLESLLPKIATARLPGQLHGYEGTASASYFGVWRSALKEDWGFETRRYNPPGDPVNALLSFGYSLLYKDFYAAVNIVGMDPYIGFFHRPRHGHAALASDLMEEHRSVVVDRLVLTAINRRQVTRQDFLHGKAGRLRLSPAALKCFLTLYANQLNSSVYYSTTGVQTTYRQVIEWQARQLARVVMGEQPFYQAFNAWEVLKSAPEED